MKNITLASPTIFALVTNVATPIAFQHVFQDNQKCFVLFIIVVCTNVFLEFVYGHYQLLLIMDEILDMIKTS